MRAKSVGRGTVPNIVHRFVELKSGSYGALPLDLLIEIRRVGELDTYHQQKGK